MVRASQPGSGGYGQPYGQPYGAGPPGAAAAQQQQTPPALPEALQLLPLYTMALQVRVVAGVTVG